VSIIIPTWNARERLEQCLDLLEKQTMTADRIVVVANGCCDDTVAYVKKHYPYVIITSLPKNLGTAGGTNAGIPLATTDYIVTLNDDAQPIPTWLEALIEALKVRPEFSFAASRLLMADGSGRIDSAGDGFDPLLGGIMLGQGQPDGPHFEEYCEVFSASGAAAIYSRDIFKTVGMFDESLFMYGDDIDLGFRARLRSHRCLYVPDAVAYHERSVAWGHNSPAQIRMIYRNGITVYVKNMPWPLVRPFAPRVVRSWLGALRHAPHRGAALRGVTEALARLPLTLLKRRQIQQTRTVDLQQLKRVLFEERLAVQPP
jgi:GT2 family glycosyltransferase